MNKYYISRATSSVYKLEDGKLYYSPIFATDVFQDSPDDWTLVEEEMVKDEPIGDPEYYANNPDKHWSTLGEVHAHIRKTLSV